MTPSIRTFLLVNLLLSVTLITSMAIVGNLFFEHKNFHAHLDAQLGMTAFTIEALLSQPSTQHPTHYPHIQSRLLALPNAVQTLDYRHDHQRRSFQQLLDSTQFQVWNKAGHLLIRSANAPNLPLYNQNNTHSGFSHIWQNGLPWRVFTAFNEKNGMRIVVAQRYDFRNALEEKLTKNAITIMLLTYPFFGLLIWNIVGRGLSSLKHIEKALKNRAPNHLIPLKMTAVPSEIQPLITALNALFKKLHDTLEREKRFAADAAHELRTPIAALGTHAQVAENAKDTASRIAALSKIHRGVKRCTHIIQQLLTMSRTAPDLENQQLTPTVLYPIAAEIIAELVPDALEKNISLSLDCPDEAVQVNGNQTALAILLRNLIDNAIRYIPEGCEIQVTIRQDATRQVQLTVADNGPGIEPELRERVFERFYRVLGNKASGSGLGLGIVLQIAQRHQADIQLSAPATGTGLVVTLQFPTTISS